MDDIGYRLMNWFASQPLTIQTALSLAFLLLIVPALFAMVIVALNKIEDRIECRLTFGSTPSSEDISSSENMADEMRVPQTRDAACDQIPPTSLAKSETANAPGLSSRMRGG